MAKKYRAVYDREKDGRWNVEIPAVKGCYTYGRTIEQARARIREALGLFVKNAETATIVDDVRLSVAARRRVKTLEERRATAALSQRKLIEAQRAVATHLHEVEGLSYRDAGAILGCTRQYAEQITKSGTA